jgi:hypothetical protein
MRKAKKPTNATATAPIAAMRGVPSIFRNSGTPCTELLPRRTTPRVPLGRFARFMVSARLKGYSRAHVGAMRQLLAPAKTGDQEFTQLRVLGVVVWIPARAGMSGER